MALQLTIDGGTRITDGRPQPPTIVRGKDEEDLMDNWNATGQWSSFDEVSFREAIASIFDGTLPLGDDEILAGAVEASQGNLKLEVVDDRLKDRIASAIDR